MPVPPFDPIFNVIPPHLGDPRVPGLLSPHRCSIEELCTAFATSTERRVILNGLLDVRAKLRSAGVSGFQWVGGSFVEEIEISESRPPRDVDVVTFVKTPANLAEAAEIIVGSDDFAWEVLKDSHSVDHYFMTLSSSPEVIVDETKYWCGLFSHRRDDLWKGMLQVNLVAGETDEAARALLKEGDAS